MVFVNCPGCNKQYENGRSLSAHLRGPCGVAAKRRSRKRQKRTAKISQDIVMTGEALLEIHDDLHDEINPSEAENEAENVVQGGLSVSCLQV